MSTSEVFEFSTRNDQTDDMTNTEELLIRYLAVWNDTDPAHRRAEIDRLWSAKAVYANALSEYRGHEQIAHGITRSHDAWVGTGHKFVSAGIAATHHNTARFVWHMFGPDGGDSVSIGTNFITFSEDGLIAGDYQFLDK
jgi:hypothetical protein